MTINYDRVVKGLLHLGLLALLGTVGSPGYGQSLGQIQWQQSFGGTNTDLLLSLREIPEGGYILVGISNSSTNGSKTSPHFGSGDYWVIRLNASGQELWEQSFGGTHGEAAYTVAPTSDGGFIVGGESYSGTNGNKTSPNFGGSDYWVLRLDGSGNKLWEASFGGSGNDVLSSLQQTSDGGFILGGWSFSGADGNKTSTNFGGGDIWFVRLDNSGNKLWERSYGGDADETGLTIEITGDDGFIFSAMSQSGTSGNKTNAFGGTWVVRLGSNGDKLWEQVMVAHYAGARVEPIANGEFMVVSAVDYDCGGQYAEYCSLLYLTRLDTTGNQVWSNVVRYAVYPGTGPPPELAAARKTADGGFVAGYRVGNLSYQGFPYHIYRLDDLGTAIWAQDFGYNGLFHSLYSIEVTRDGGFILGGYSAQPPSGNKTSPNFGWADYWVVKLFPEQPQLELLPRTNATEKVRFLLQTSYFGTYVVERSTDLSTWQSWQTNSFNGTTLEFVDRDTNQASNMFYRARRLP